MRDEQLARGYLLGGAGWSDSELEAAEQRLLTDPDFGLLVECVERDLYDEFAAGSLAPGERAAFLRYLESHPDAAGRLRFSAALQQSAARQARRRKSNWSWPLPAAAIAASLLVATSSAVAWWILHTRGDSPPPRPATEPAVYAFALRPGTLRSATDQPQSITIPPQFVAVSIRLEGAGPETQAARLYFVDTGREVWKGAVRDGRVRIPAALLVPGDHVITTIGGTAEEIADYTFRIVRPPQP